MPENCITCFGAELPSCIEQFTVKGNLSPNTEYTWCLTDKFGNKLFDQVTADGSGTIICADTSFENLLRSFSGSFTLTVAANGSGVNTNFTICGTQYPCIIISMYDWQGTQPEAVIGQCS